ncbi:MAG: HypC/HybG/HupF family hydrogenase formation chaperone [Mycobacteriales bacterium]
MNTEDHCSVTDGCITCGDIAVPLTVVSMVDMDARCCDEQGREEMVAVELVGALAPGDRVLVHAGVAIERLSADLQISQSIRSGE